MTDDRATQPLVLVVEDDDSIRRLIQDTLEEERYRVVTAIDGESALELLHTTEPDLILLDVRLPGIDGIAVAAAYRAMSVARRAPIILVSAARPGRELPDGVVAFVRKPFDLDAMLARVAEVLSRRP